VLLRRSRAGSATVAFRRRWKAGKLMRPLRYMRVTERGLTAFTCGRDEWVVECKVGRIVRGWKMERVGRV